MTFSNVVNYTKSVRWLSPLVVLIMTLLSVGAATSHDALIAKNPEEARVFHFYSTWMRPPARFYSCCSMEDCHTVRIKREGASYFFLDAFSFSDGARWREIPPDVIEQNAPAPRESPDGQSHVCFNQSVVLCAVFGSGQ